MSDISRMPFIKAVQAQAKLADKLEKEKGDDTPEFRKILRMTASNIRGVIRDICNDLDIDVPGVNVPNELCTDCGGEDGDHGDECPADKLAALGKNW